MYVVIVKTYGEIARTEANEGYPSDWPADCRQVETIQEAHSYYPDRPVMSISDYNAFAKGLALAHSLVPMPVKKKNPWWKFWK